MNLNTEQYFSEIPQIHAPRSVFDRSFTHKTTMNVNKLYPIFIDEALPGDSFKLHFQAFGRLVDPLVVPIMDELYFETLWFKCPMRLVWDNTFKFFGEKENPSDTTTYVIPTINSGTGFTVDSLADHFGIPVGVANLDVNALPFRMYNLTYNQWFRDQNLINSLTVPKGDTDSASNYSIVNSAKMHDVFTSCLTTTQLGSPAELSLGTSANVSVYGNGRALTFTNGTTDLCLGGASGSSYLITQGFSTGTYPIASSTPTPTSPPITGRFGLTTDATRSGLVGTCDLTSATGINVNDLRFLIKLQQYRERMLTGGHRYREIISQFFNVDQLDNRAYTVEFLGMTREMVDINSVVQTSSTDSVSPQGFVTAYGMVSTHESGFSTSFVEHSYVMGIARFRHNPVYQQGLNKLWSRSTQLDFYNPMFNGLGEQPVLNKEIMAQGASVLDTNGDIIDDQAFGFNEAWYEYRYYPSIISGQLRSGISQSLDVYHLAQYFGTYSSGTYTPVLPVLNQSFIEENIPMNRVLAVNSGASVPQFVMDFRFMYVCAREIPVRNIPAGLTSGL